MGITKRRKQPHLARENAKNGVPPSGKQFTRQVEDDSEVEQTSTSLEIRVGQTELDAKQSSQQGGQD